MTQTDTIVLLGTGALGSALARGLAARSAYRERIYLVDVDAERARELARTLDLRHGAVTQLGETAAFILVAVKPGDVTAALGGCHNIIDDDTVVVSCAAGVDLATLAAACGSRGRFLRAMPNVAARAGQAAVGLVAANGIDEAVVAEVETMLRAIGSIWRLSSESQMHAVTALAGSGPAFAALVVEALIDGAVASGLHRDLAGDMALQMLRGTLELLEQGTSPAELRASVSSPAGTTVAGLGLLERRATRAALADAVVAAADRSRELAP